MNLINKFRSMLAGRARAGQEDIDDLARLAARDQVDLERDVPRIEKALGETAMVDSTRDLEQRIEIVKRYDAAVAIARKLPDRLKEMAAAEDREAKAAEAWLAQRRKREAQASELAWARIDLGVAIEQCLKALAVQQELEHAHPQLLQVKPIDLDAYTLIHNGTQINIADPLAEQRFVAADVFARESARRRRIAHHALRDAMERQGRAIDAWTATLRTDMNGRPIDDGKMPKLTGWTWREIVAAGHCRLFDKPIPDEPALAGTATVL